MDSGPAPRRLRIVHVDAERGFDGGEVQVFLLIQGLAESGHEQCLVAPPGSLAEREVRGRAFAREVAFEPVEQRGDLSLGAVRRIARVLRAFRPDVVHLHTGRATWLGSLAARRVGLPAITTRRMSSRLRPHLRNRLVYRRWVARAVGIAPAVTERLRELGVPEARLATIPSSIDPSLLGCEDGGRGLRDELCVQAGQLVVATLATLERRKGLDVLIEAFGDALRAGAPADARLWICGEGSERDALADLAHALGLGGQVRLLGRRERNDVLAACDVFCLPSRSEGLGVAALEAMAVGKPVLASRVGGLGWAVEDGRSGILCAPEDRTCLARGLVRLLTEPELREELGRGGRDVVRERFLAERMVEAYERLYTSVLEERAASLAS